MDIRHGPVSDGCTQLQSMKTSKGHQAQAVPPRQVHARGRSNAAASFARGGPVPCCAVLMGQYLQLWHAANEFIGELHLGPVGVVRRDQLRGQITIPVK